jgi:DNA-binding GntR family transcriptional regulator
MVRKAVDPSVAEAGSGSVVDRACARLHRLLVQGRLVGGQPLIETDLAAQLAVSRGTVREALRRLESEGLLVGRARGLQVRRLSRRDVTDLYALREHLEGWAARLAAQTGSIEAARLAQERTVWSGAESRFGLAAFGEQNRRFHDLMVEAAGNAHLPRVLDQTLLVLFAAQFRGWVTPGSVAAAAEDHLLVLDAVAAQRGAAAERAMRRHIVRSGRAITRLPEEAFA